MSRLIEGRAGEGLSGRIGIVASRYNALVVDALVSGALEACRRLQIPTDQVDIVRVPGALEIPLAAKALAKTTTTMLPTWRHAVLAISCLNTIFQWPMAYCRARAWSRPCNDQAEKWATKAPRRW